MIHDTDLSLANQVRLLTTLAGKLLDRIKALEAAQKPPRAPHVPRPKPSRTMAEITDAVCFATGVTLAEMRAHDHTRRVSRPRQEAMLAMHEAGFSSPMIGQFLGGRDHTTILVGARAAKKRRGGQ